MISFLQQEPLNFLWIALLGGICMAVVMAPIGTLLIWRRQSFYGDSLAHGAVLGVACAQWMNVPPEIGVITSSILMGVGATFFQRKSYFTNDALLSLLSYGSLALGLILFKTLGKMTTSVESLLFGDLLLLTKRDLLFLFLGGSSVLLIIKLLWDSLLQIAINPALAHVQGIHINRVDYCFRILIGIVIAVTFRYSGTLLLASLLILPPLIARPFSKSPESMVLKAAGIGTFCILGGIGMSWITAWPTTPSIVLLAFLLFLLTTFLAKKK
jgi:zinc transport system permease protein